MKRIVHIIKSGLLLSVISVQTMLFPLGGIVLAEGETTTPAAAAESAGSTPPTSPDSTPAPSGQPTPPPTTEPQPSSQPSPPPTTGDSSSSQGSNTSSSSAPSGSSTPPSAPTPKTGPAAPTGAAASTFTYNPATGLWENDYYTWNPATGKTTPKTSQEYMYHPESGTWSTGAWAYNPLTRRYEQNAITGTGPYSTNTISGLAPGTNGYLGLTGPYSNNQLGFGSSFDGSYNGNFNGTITNNLHSAALTGNAAVLQNTSAGSATTGDALAMANVLNMMQSSWNPLHGGEITTFSADITGDMYGDLYIDPDMIMPQQEVGVATAQDSQLDINIDANGQINNNITLDAGTGSATVSGNTTAGNAKTGDANAVANVVNMINSTIAAGNSFFGVINIHGSLRGDILFPENDFQNLFAHNAAVGSTSATGGAITDTGPYSSNTITGGGDTDVTAEFNETHSIRNNILTGAASGNAIVSENTTAGNAHTGSAATNITLFNLTGRQVQAGRGLLVFVNVLGKWVGLIVDAPNGATNAALGSDVTNNSLVPANVTAGFTANNTSEINNNIVARAHTGDATVQANTTAGDATSGNATASVNVLNISTSQLALSDWFGVLFINVFGSWNGSFGVDTAAGDAPAGGRGGGSGRAFDFRPHETSSQESTQSTRATFAASTTTGASARVNGTVTQATRAATAAARTAEQSNSPASSENKAASNWTLPLIALAVGAVLVGVERLFGRRQEV